MMDSPSHETVERARISLNRDRRSPQLTVIWTTVGVALGLVLTILAFALGVVVRFVALPILVIGATLLWVYAVALLDLPPPVVSWTRVGIGAFTPLDGPRPPDGCNPWSVPERESCRSQRRCSSANSSLRDECRWVGRGRRHTLA